MLIDIKPPSIGESRTKRKTRIMILTTAFELFSQNGFFSTSVVDISKTARVTRRTFYNYYKTKEDVIRELHPVVMESLFKIINQRWQSEKGNTTDIRSYLTALYETITQEKGLVRYLVKYDRFSNSRLGLMDDAYLLDCYIEEHSEIRPIITSLFNPGDEGADNNGADALSRVCIHSLLAFLSRFTFREHSYLQEGSLGSDHFGEFLDCILKKIEGKVFV